MNGLKSFVNRLYAQKKVNERFVCIMRTFVNNSSHVNGPSSTRSEAMVPVAYFEGVGEFWMVSEKSWTLWE